MAELSGRDEPLAFPRDSLFESGVEAAAEVTVCITLHDYDSHIVDALESVFAQDFSALGLAILDDFSVDSGPERVERWLESNARRFAFSQLARHRRNHGLAASRNGAFELSPSEFVLTLDADNQLYPRCVTRLHTSLAASDAGFAYSLLEQFGGAGRLLGCEGWSRELLRSGNYIDAMSLVRKSVWRRVGGYTRMQVAGWEDFDFWCKLVEAGIDGLQVPEILARYRAHPTSMLQTVTRDARNELNLRREMQQRHPWLEL